ncbi:MAG: hypothetical protein NC432_14620 [Roseburia sp.]|nr:hypothetical protein [Roseburia sp.]MCM1098653.1 hypothetical protein [Ruminococcus flavefaciens]
MIYSPEKHTMYCPFCESEKSEELSKGTFLEMQTCPNCGGEVPVEEHTSATQCPYCDSYLILDERVEGKYAPKLILPFQLGKESCKKSLRERFRKNLFAPADFLSEARLESMQGVYVPYWLFGYETHCSLQGEGTKVRVWRSGDTEYTETSLYAVEREIDIAYDKIPADASNAMPDPIMDLMEPYNYGQLESFKPEYLSGFYGEKYNMESTELEGRAREKMTESADIILRESYAGYSTFRAVNREIRARNSETSYGLLPVWKYDYTYNGQSYPFYINGQTGKIVGETPVSKGKALAYAGTVFVCVLAILLMAPMLI